MQTATVRYRVDELPGEINIPCSTNDDDAAIEAKAKKLLKQQARGWLLFQHSIFKVVRRI